ncbi:hypothetical protein BJX99DRAFT_223238 [Aspergillus californicus]
MPGQRLVEGDRDFEDPEYAAAQEARYKHALLLLVETIRRNHPSETIGLIDAIRRTDSVPQAAELLIRLSELGNQQKPDSTGSTAPTGEPDGAGAQQ